MKNSYRLLCFGDSITKSYSKRIGKVLLEKYPKCNIQVINEGVVSETTVRGITRLNKMLEYTPDIVLIGFGMNDWRKGVDEETFGKNLKKMVTTFKENGIRPILLTMNPDAHTKNKVSEKLVKYNDIIRSVAYKEKIRIADVYSLWLKDLPYAELGLYDEIHPNEHVGNKIICEAISRVIFRTHSVVVWGFNGLYPFCNYACPYCYVASDVNDGHYFRKDLPLANWRKGFETAFGEEKIVFYFSFGEPTLSAGFYDVLDMIAEKPNWYGHMTSNLSVPLDRLINSKIVRQGKLFVNASFHPTETDEHAFLKKLLILRENGVECSIVLVAYPAILKDFEHFIQFFGENDFLVHVRRFRGWYEGKYYPKSYTNDERILIAKYCDDATIKYMLNESSVNFKGHLTYEGMYYVLVDENGDVWNSPDSKDKYLGNLFKENVHFFTEPQQYSVSWNGSVNGVAALLETGYTELTGNFVSSFSSQGGVYKTPTGVHYKNKKTDFTDPKVRKEYGFPSCEVKESRCTAFSIMYQQKLNKPLREFVVRKLYPYIERKRRAIIKYIYNLLH